MEIQPNFTKTKSVTNESVQVGISNVKYGSGHYMFDPSKDAMFDVPPKNEDNLAFIRSAWTDQIDTTKIHQDVQSIIQSEIFFFIIP